MASDFDRDNAVDQLLRGARRDPRIAEAGPSCLDAETLAAWADGSLEEDRARRVEAHVADCARCQAMSAAFFATDEGAVETGPRVVPFRNNRVMYWLPVAAATIAATLVIWMGIHGRNLPEPTSAMSDALLKETRGTPLPSPGASGQTGNQAQRAAETVAPPAAASKPAESQVLARAKPRDPELRAERQKQEAKAATSRADAAATARAGGNVAAPPPAPNASVPVAGNALTRQAMAPPPPPPVVMPTPTATPTTSTVSRGLGQSAAAGALSESVTFRSSREAQVIVEFSSMDPRASTISGLPGTMGGVAGGAAGAGGRGGGGGGGRGAAVVADFAGAPARVHWRILSSDVVERTTDRVTWEAVTITPSVKGLGLLHGSAPSPTVCWLAGRAGLVLLAADGRQFIRVTPPTLADLTSILAIDARQATVTAAGGQTFTTTDGGKTWK